jgi:hypothetical protein
MDSPNCLNFNDRSRPNACDGCSLMQFVPDGLRDEPIRCWTIPIGPENPDGGELVRPQFAGRTREESYLVRQLDSIRVLAFTIVLFSQNLFQPLRLPPSNCLVHNAGIMKDDEFLSATVTPKSAHCFEIWRSLFRLALLDRHCLHLLPLYLCAGCLFLPLEQYDCNNRVEVQHLL